MLFEFVRNALPFLGVNGRRAVLGDVGPFLGVFGVHGEPLLETGLGVCLDGFGRAFRLADAAIDALVRVDHEHIFAFVEAVHGADFHAVHELTLDAGFGDDIGHKRVS